jgi:hypothetical protein
MRKNIRMVIRADAMMLPTMAMAVCVAVMAVVCEAVTWLLACAI